MATSSTTAISAASFVSSIGVNTHFDFNAYGYENLSVTEAAINYLGIKNLRDSANTTGDLTTWQQVSAATGAKFDDYMPEGAPSGLQYALTLVPNLAAEHILNYVEGGNEDDDPYAISNGNSLAWTATFQQQVYSVGHSLGLPVINMSFGAGWTAANNWHGDYDKVGDLSAYTDYANAHTYANPGQTPDSAIQFINGLSKLAAASRPTMTTEIGWDENAGFSQAQIAQFVVDAVLDGIKDGDVKTYFYALYDDGAGRFGLMNQDGTAKPAGMAIHDLTTLLADSGGSFTPGSLSYGLSGTVGGENTLLMQKSDGSDWIAVWDETDGAHSVTLNLGSTASQIVVYDPVKGTSAVQTLSNASAVTLNLNGDPLLVKVGGASGTTSGGTTSGGTTSGGTTSGGTTSGGTTSGGTTSGGTTSGGTTSGTSSPTDLTVTVPASATVAANATDAITGASITDPWAAATPGTMALNLWDNTGAALLVNGTNVSGTINGTLSQLNADLASLKYQAGAGGSDTVTVDVWNQAGVEVTKTIKLSIGGSTSGGTTSGGTTSGGTTSGGTTSGGTTSGGTTSGTSSPTDLTVTVPASATVAANATDAITGASITDPWAAATPGTMALNLWDNTGAALLVNGTNVSGTINGTLSQLNADLASLKYQAGGAGSDTVTVDVWNQAGVEVTKTINLTIGSSTSGGTTSGGTTSGGTTSGGTTSGGTSTSTVTIAATDTNPVINSSNVTISATSGNHMIFIGGSFDTLSAVGGTEQVLAFQGSNTITTGAGNDVIQFAGSGNKVNAGTGTNQISDAGSNNTLILGPGGTSNDTITGYVLQNGDTLDLRPTLASTKWTGSSSTLGSFLHERTSGADTIISVTPSGVAGSTSYDVVTLKGTGGVTMATLLAHSIV